MSDEKIMWLSLNGWIIGWCHHRKWRWEYRFVPPLFPGCVTVIKYAVFYYETFQDVLYHRQKLLISIKTETGRLDRRPQDYRSGFV